MTMKWWHHFYRPLSTEEPRRSSRDENLSVKFGPCCFCARDIEEVGTDHLYRYCRDGHGRRASMEVPRIMLPWKNCADLPILRDCSSLFIFDDEPSCQADPARVLELLASCRDGCPEALMLRTGSRPGNWSRWCAPAWRPRRASGCSRTRRRRRSRACDLLRAAVLGDTKIIRGTFRLSIVIALLAAAYFGISAHVEANNDAWETS